MVKLDDILVDLNEFGKYQKLKYFLICLCALLPPCFAYIHSFAAAKPPFRCSHPDIPSDSYSFNANEYFNNTIKFNQCDYVFNGTKHKCNSWVFDKTYYRTTLTEEWTMICKRSILRSNVQTVYFIGYFIGSIILGVLADKFGRRPILLSSFIIIIIGGLMAAFGPHESIGVTPSYVIYTIGRFLIAVGTRGINVTGFVLALEIVGPSKRTMAGIFFKFSFAIGQYILLFFAYFIRDWRTLSWVMVLPAIPFLSYFFLMHESVRWLMIKNRKSEAHKILLEIARTNKTKLNEESWKQFSEKKKSKKKKDPNAENLMSVFSSPILILLMSTLFLNWAANNFVFYGLGMKSNDLGLNPYVTFFISVTCELAGYIVIYFLIKKYGRKKPYIFFLFLSGLSCFSVVFMDDAKSVVAMAMLGKFFVSSTYALIQLYSTEIFPTSIRNSCMGACSMIARLGPIAAPMITGLGDRTWKPLPFLVFGVSGVLAAISSIVLPETLNQDLPSSIADTEKLVRTGLDCMRKRSTLEESEVSGTSSNVQNGKIVQV